MQAYIQKVDRIIPDPPHNVTKLSQYGIIEVDRIVPDPPVDSLLHGMTCIGFSRFNLCGPPRPLW